MAMGNSVMEATLGAELERLREIRSAVQADYDAKIAGIDKQIEEIEWKLAEERRRDASRP
jgi:hypothetical protein